MSTKLEKQLNRRRWWEAQRRKQALARLVELSRQGDIPAILALARAARQHADPVTRGIAQEAVQAARGALEAAFASPEAHHLRELAAELGPDYQYVAEVRLGKAAPPSDWEELARWSELARGPFGAELRAWLGQQPGRGSLPFRAACLLLSEQVEELLKLDPEGDEVARALARCEALRPALLDAVRRHGLTLGRPARVPAAPEDWRRRLEESCREGDWDGLLFQLERELPLRACRLLEEVGRWPDCSTVLRAMSRPAPPPTTLEARPLTGNEPVFSHDDRRLILRLGTGLLLTHPRGEPEPIRVPFYAGEHDLEEKPLLACSLDGTLLGTCWQGAEYWETADHMYSGWAPKDVLEMVVHDLDTLERRTILLEEPVKALAPGAGTILIATTTQLVAASLRGTQWKLPLRGGADLHVGRWLVTGNTLYQLEPFLELGPLPYGATFFLEDRMVIGGRLVSLPQMQTLANLTGEPILEAAGGLNGPLALRTPAAVELHDRDRGTLLARRPVLGDAWLHPRGDHVLSWKPPVAELYSVMEDEPWARWILPEEAPRPRFSPRGTCLYSEIRNATLVLELPPYRPLDRLGPAHLALELPGELWRRVEDLVRRRLRHEVQLGEGSLQTWDVELEP